MNKSLRTGILAAMLVLPVFIFLFLYKEGDNMYAIPVIRAKDSVKVQGNTYKITDAETVPDFKFITNKGTYLTNKDLSNSVYVVDFFFTKCPSICKEMTSQLVRVQETFKDNSQVKLVSFTVDPTNDSPQVLDAYAKYHRAIPDKWYFLTGSKDSIYTLAKNGFYLTVLQGTSGPDEFDHAPHFVLVDKKGWIRGYYNGTDAKEVDRLITEIKILLLEYESDKR